MNNILEQCSMQEAQREGQNKINGTNTARLTDAAFMQLFTIDCVLFGWAVDLISAWDVVHHALPSSQGSLDNLPTNQLVVSHVTNCSTRGLDNLWTEWFMDYLTCQNIWQKIWSKYLLWMWFLKLCCLFVVLSTSWLRPRVGLLVWLMSSVANNSKP